MPVYKFSLDQLEPEEFHMDELWKDHFGEFGSQVCTGIRTS